MLAAASRSLGPIADTSATVLIGLALIALFLTGLRLPCPSPAPRPALLGMASAVVGWSLLVQAGSPVLHVGAIGFLLAGIHHLLASVRSRLPDFRQLLTLVLTATLLLAAFHGLPWLGEASLAASRFWTRLWSPMILPQPIDAGPTALGGPILGLALLAAIALCRPRYGRAFPWQTFFRAIAGLVVANLVFLRLLNEPRLIAPDARSQFLAQGIQLLLVVPVLAWLRLPRGQTRRPTRPATVPLRWTPIAASGLLVLTGVLLAAWPLFHPATPGTIAFLDSGFVDWKKPVHGKYGAFETGLFGSAPDYLASAGRKSFVTKHLTGGALSNASVLVIINPTNRWAAGEVDAVWDFVRRGGGLWVLGDHTDIMGSKAPLDELLRPTGIEFRFDSAFPARPEWRDCLLSLAHPVTRQLQLASDAVISVGASLHVPPPAHTVVWGRYGFSDLGNHVNIQGAYLGDYAYQRGELLGDVSLVAATRHGRGRVLVFGDTSPLQNGALPLSFQAMVEPCLDWLDGDDWPVWPWIRWAALAVGLSSLIPLLGKSRSPLVLLTATGALLAGIAAGPHLTPSRPATRPTNTRIALVDRSHANRVSLAPLLPESIGPFLVTLMRSGFQPRILDHWSAGSLQSASTLIVTAPADPFSRSELDEVQAFVQDGGLLVVNCGWSERGRAARDLLTRFGFDVLRLPLGPYPVQRVEEHLPGQAQFINAWPVVVTEPTLQSEFKRAVESYRAPVLDSAQAGMLARLLSPLGGAPDPANPIRNTTPTPTNPAPVRVLYQTHDGHPIVVARSVGQGSVVVIGDSLFLGTDNLENLRYHRKGNLLFIKHLFETLNWRRR